MIFDPDYSSGKKAITGLSHFVANQQRVFSILRDPASWEISPKPKITSSSMSDEIVFAFPGFERASVELGPWKTELTQLRVVIDGLADESASLRQQLYWSELTRTIAKRLLSDSLVVASAPGKVNVFFAVGAFLKDGYHEVASCYQGLSLREQVLVELSGSFGIDFSGPFREESQKLVPRDRSNLVFKAAEILGEVDPRVRPELVSFLIHKSVPIAGGMAGGSADAAAALVAINELFSAGLDERLVDLAAKLGADVPFSLVGGTAVGLGRGELLTEVPTEGVLHWVMTPNPVGLSTPEVYRKLDILRTEWGIDVSKLESPVVPRALVQAVKTSDALALSKLMHNDLERAALALRPELAAVINEGVGAGALRSMVSGSGPTIAHLVSDAVTSDLVATRLDRAGFPSLVTHSSSAGARLER